MKKTVLAGLVLMVGQLILSGCGRNSIELDKSSTVSYDPVKDKPGPPAGGPGGNAGPAMGGKGSKKGAAAPGQ